jgi:hypothetical protein
MALKRRCVPFQVALATPSRPITARSFAYVHPGSVSIQVTSRVEVGGRQVRNGASWGGGKSALILSPVDHVRQPILRACTVIFHSAMARRRERLRGMRLA